MNTPSRVSISDMPAANRMGSEMIASAGSPPATAAVADRPSRPTSVAVSNPSPNRTPTG